ncbi:hypothetical protein JW979_11860, partial [bacterium]|nr:hypothetical protein [candidate division CSSED10-310 bacterium]
IQFDILDPMGNSLCIGYYDDEVLILYDLTSQCVIKTRQFRRFFEEKYGIEISVSFLWNLLGLQPWPEQMTIKTFKNISTAQSLTVKHVPANASHSGAMSLSAEPWDFRIECQWKVRKFVDPTQFRKFQFPIGIRDCTREEIERIFE